MKSLFFLLLFILANPIQRFMAEAGENKLVLSFSILLNKQKILLNDSSYYLLNNKDSILISAFQYYIGGIELLHSDKVVWKDKIPFHLIQPLDAEKTSLTFDIPENTHFQTIRFLVGTDSVVNKAGVMGGDLDPTKGMYWTWQSGYINFKIEGNSNLSTAVQHDFIFHLGGYQNPYATCNVLSFPCKEKNNIDIQFDLSKWILSSGIQSGSYLMSPGQRAFELSRLAANCFYLAP